MKIDTSGIELSYGTNQILKGIDLHADNKEFIGILGPNGSGKSTFLKCVYRVLKPDAGCIFLNEEPVDKMSYKESAKKVAVLSQHNYYNFDFSVKEVVMMGRAPHKKTMSRDSAQDYAIVNEALERVNMQSFANRSFATLSGGEQQRVILARALAQQTPCLILDEPTNHLDITYQLELMRLVKGLDVTVIAAIHDLNIAAAFCDRIYMLQDGNIAAEGTPEEVLTVERIEEIYHVKSEIMRDGNGTMHILFSAFH